MVVRLQLIIAGPAGSPYHAHAVTHSCHSGSCATASPQLCVVNDEKLILSPWRYFQTIYRVLLLLLFFSLNPRGLIVKVKLMCWDYKTYSDLTSGNLLCILTKDLQCSDWTALLMHITFFFPKETLIQKLLISELDDPGCVVFREEIAPHLSRYESRWMGPCAQHLLGPPRLHPQSFLQMRTVVSI